jgi:hypothetical protein
MWERFTLVGVPDECESRQLGVKSLSAAISNQSLNPLSALWSAAAVKKYYSICHTNTPPNSSEDASQKG